MSSIESAPAAIPPMSVASFAAGFAPLSAPVVDTVRRSSARSSKPAFWARPMIGTSPVVAVRFSSSKEWDTVAGVWLNST
jgi:hypothetical protein